MKRAAKTEASRTRILEAAGKAFRRHGLGGIGVDGLAKKAKLTSGAFYVHFQSKMEAFQHAVREGLRDLIASVAKLQAEDETNWAANFASLYLGPKRTCTMERGCTVPLLSAEVERSGPELRREYENQMKELIEVMAGKLPAGKDTTSEERAYALMALLAGGALISRTVHDPALSERIAAAVQKQAVRLALERS